MRIGILGGGQLARMLALAGIPLGFDCEVLDPSADACAAAVARLRQAGFDDHTALRSLARAIDLATFDFENVPADSARVVAAQCPFAPSVAALETCQDRLAEKRLLAELGIPVPGYAPVDSLLDLEQACERLGFPCLLKTRRLGYDGKGQFLQRAAPDIERAWAAIGGAGLVLEAFVPFAAECSLLAVRGRAGETRFWPLTRNLHCDGILQLSRPGGIPSELQGTAEAMVRLLLEHFDYAGVIAVEFFLHGGRLLANEIAPRVHNSGHWTIDGAVTSQFENHLRAIAGLPLGDTALTSHNLMFNWIGSLPSRAALLAVPGLHWHEYGKAARLGRKLGHATLTADSEEELAHRASQVAGLLGEPWPRQVTAILGPPTDGVPNPA